MHYRPGINEHVTQRPFTLSKTSPETVLVTPDVPPCNLTRMHQFRWFARRWDIICIEQLVNNIFISRTRKRHFEDGPNKQTDACGAIYFDFGLGITSVNRGRERAQRQLTS